MMTTNERKLIQSTHRQIEEIISDPNAKWDDIRKAMKAHGTGACTNAALVRALSTGMGPTRALSDREVSVKAPVAAAAPPPSVNTRSNEIKSEPSEEESGAGFADSYNEGMDWNKSETYIIPTFVPLSENDGMKTKKPGLSATRRGSHASCSSLATASSVDMMNFGVDHFAEHDDGSSAYNCDFASRASFGSTYTCETDGFIGWKRSDSKSTLSDTTNDEDGFLTWEASSSERIAASEAEKIAKEVGRASEYEENTEPRKSWHIEDYEGLNDSTPTLASTNSKTHNFFSSLRNLTADKGPERARSDSFNNSDPYFWKRYTPVPATKASRESPSHETDELDKDVRKALLNLRRSNLNEETEDSANTQSKENTETKRSSLHTMFSGLSMEATTRRGKERRRSTIDLPCAPFEGERPKHSTGPNSFNIVNEDQREAIWIKKTDGDVDIEKECRKLYLESENQQKKPPRGRRASIFGGEIPKVFKRNEESDGD
jgi:hypothetical protein